MSLEKSGIFFDFFDTESLEIKYNSFFVLFDDSLLDLTRIKNKVEIKSV